jgi:hypothetical protein
MDNIPMKLIQVVIPPYRVALLENLIRVARLKPAARLSPDSSHTLNVVVKVVGVEDQGGATDELPDITDALIDNTNCKETTEHAKPEEVFTGNKNSKSTPIGAKTDQATDLTNTSQLGRNSFKTDNLIDDLILQVHAQGRMGQLDISFDESEIEKLVCEIGSLEVQAQYQRLEMINPFELNPQEKARAEEVLSAIGSFEEREKKHNKIEDQKESFLPKQLEERKAVSNLRTLQARQAQANDKRSSLTRKFRNSKNLVEKQNTGDSQIVPIIRKRRLSKIEQRSLAIGLTVF